MNTAELLERRPTLLEDYYPFPLAWLADIEEVSQLDVYDAVLSMARWVKPSSEDAQADGGTIGSAGAGEADSGSKRLSAWCLTTEKTLLRPLLSGPTMHDGIRRMLDCRRICRYGESTERFLSNLPVGTHTADEVIDVRYEIRDWERVWNEEEILLRPRGYIDNRWPAWFFNKDASARLVFLAFDHARTELLAAGEFTAAASVTLLWRELRAALPTLLPGLGQRSVGEIERVLNRGVHQLKVMGALRIGEGQESDRLTQELRVLGEPPFEREADFPRQGGASATRSRTAADVLEGNLVRYGRMRADHLLDKHNRRIYPVAGSLPLLLKHYPRQYSHDLIQIARMVKDWRETDRSARTQRRPTKAAKSAPDEPAWASDLRRFVHDYIGAQAHKSCVPGAQITLKAAAACWGVLEGDTVSDRAWTWMQPKTHHGLEATQLLVHYRLSSPLEEQVVRLCVESLRLYVVQALKAATALQSPDVHRVALDGIFTPDDAEAPTDYRFIPLPSPTYDPYGVTLDCNRQLHGDMLDYSRPFALLLFCTHPTPHLTLECQFRTLAAQG